MGFDPDAAAGAGSGIFGLASGPGEARVHVVPVPFDATASYRKGAARAPEAVLAASRQVDLLDLVTGRPWEAGIWMAPADDRVAAWNAEATARAARVMERPGEVASDPSLAADRDEVDRIGAALNAHVEAAVGAALDAGKLAVTLGGDHAVAVGAIAAHAARHPGMGILHVDAHADLRVAYEGLRWSHASVLHNVLAEQDVGPLLQVGLRDLGQEELEAIRGSEGRVTAVFDHQLAEARYAGSDLRGLVRGALDRLPREVYVTFDVDGLDPTLCPGTGTPVPGGLSWHDAMLWLGELARSGRRIVGCDLVEVSPGEAGGDGWDAIVGARLLYRLIGFALLSRGEAASG